MQGISLTKKITCIAASFALSFLLIPLQAFAALSHPSASNETVASQLAQQNEEAFAQIHEEHDLRALTNNSVFSQGASSGQEDSMQLFAELPSSYDLRDRGAVTPVKLQNPWGDCWGFAAIAASEISYITETSTPASDVNFSELQVGWFAYNALPSGLPGTAGTQATEGLYPAGQDVSSPLNVGGVPFTATSVLSSGTGPVPESTAPYMNAQGTIEYLSNGVPFCYSADGDWSVAESKRFLQTIQLEESRILPSPASTDEHGAYLYNEQGTQSIKQELLDGRGVEITLFTENAMPGDSNAFKYMNTDTWAQYTYQPAAVDHAVTIVGWDDSYPKENFVPGHEPPAHGAWIVKNSWGAADQEFPNWNIWGVDGNGYFYLSYYDQSIQLAESFNYNVYTTSADPFTRIIDQYDYMPASSVNAARSPDPLSMANVFTASQDQNVTAISVETAHPGTSVQYELYRLNEGYANPTDGQLLESGNTTYPYGGYHRIELNGSYTMNKGESYSVVCTQNYDGDYLVVADECINKAGYQRLVDEGYSPAYYGVGIVNPGESFMLENDAWQDWAEVISEILAGEDESGLTDYDNFALKAYAQPLETEEVTHFADVPIDAWYTGSVNYVYEHNIMHGYAGTNPPLFGPNDDILRCDALCTLCNHYAPSESAMSPFPFNETPFSDVESGQYYTASVNWGYKEGIVGGYAGTDLFGTSDPLTREQFAQIMRHIAGATDISEAAVRKLDSFPDGDDVSDWAVDSMAWAVQEGLISGAVENGLAYLRPQDNCTRAEVAKMISAYLVNSGGGNS